ncbi:hypothetical protein IAQ61_004067 [Plenodomus lingam]|uniref:uncharacterized protein n=1 Tax=Leptosphaeria maculans TaxID=5022 RepID=UPI00332B3BD1|nr:hypothetical protein IAQ61_004067 [Plenodomus lingam]
MSSIPIEATRTRKEAAKITERNSNESPFLRLPGELRNRIYDLAFGNHIVEIDNTAFEDKKPVFHHICLTKDHTETPYTFFDILNMTTTCRQIYYETFKLPLTENKFKMSSKTPLDLAKHISPWQVACIQTIQIRFWNSSDFERDWHWDGYDWGMYKGISHVVVPVLKAGVVRQDGRVDFNDRKVREILRGTFGENVRVEFEFQNTGPFMQYTPLA